MSRRTGGVSLDRAPCSRCSSHPAVGEVAPGALPRADLCLECLRRLCPDCGRDSLPRVGHCRGGRYEGCCRSFKNLGDADSHRTGPYASRRCRSDEELLGAGWVVEGDYWVSPVTLAGRGRYPRSVQRAAQGASSAPGGPGTLLEDPGAPGDDPCDEEVLP